MARKVIGMARNVVGRTGSWPKRWAVPLFLIITVGAGAVFIRTVLAVHDTGAFELDGNATSVGVADDWDRVFNGTSAATATSFTSETALNATIFVGGGSKDPQDISQWAWKDENNAPPAKDNLLHSFAARYSLPPTLPGGSCPNGTGGPGQPDFNPDIRCDVLFFGSDRFDNSGDATQGFWFFQNAIGLGTNTVGGGQGFTGVHEPGDLLIISDFSNGGTTSSIGVFRWDPLCTATNKPDGTCADANLRRLATSTAANCATATAGDAFCGLVNPGPLLTDAPWGDFLDKSGNTDFLNGEFFEGGVNLTVLGLAGECFASVASETRSSTSPTATLKDFVLGGFAACESGLTTTPKQVVNGGVANIPAGGLSIGTGSVLVKDSAELVITGLSTWTGTLKFFLCGPADLVSQATCTTGGTQIGALGGITVTNATSQPILSDQAEITSAGAYCWRGEFDSGTNGVPDDTDASPGECFTVNPVQPAITTDASADPPTGVPLGTAISDSATLSLTANQPGTPVINPVTAGSPADGTITFNLYGPNDATCTTTPVFTSVVDVSGNAAYGSGDFTPTLPGTYRWIASYSGDLPNTLSVSGACGDTNEASLVIVLQPTIATAQTFTVKDSATITVGALAGNLTGSVRFRLFDNATCSGGLLFDSGALGVNGPSPQTVETVTTTITVSQPTLSWLVEYTSTNQGHSNVTSACNTEHASLTIVNGG